MIWQICCCKRFDKYHVCPWADEFFQSLPLKSNGRDECQLIRGWTGYSPTDKEGFCLLGQTSRWEGDGCCWGGQVSKGGWKAGEGGGTREANKGRTKWPGIENEGDRAASESEAWMEIEWSFYIFIYVGIIFQPALWTIFLIKYHVAKFAQITDFYQLWQRETFWHQFTWN